MHSIEPKGRAEGTMNLGFDPKNLNTFALGECFVLYQRIVKNTATRLARGIGCAHGALCGLQHAGAIPSGPDGRAYAYPHVRWAI